MDTFLLESIPARVVVAIDFGTTFSGFAYALKSDPEIVYSFYDWPSQVGGKPYCKTVSSLLYQKNHRGIFTFDKWGWEAVVKYAESSNVHDVFLAKFFKLYLAPNNPCSGSILPDLPKGLTPDKLISDLLSKLSSFIMGEVKKKFGNHLKEEDIQWCLTVPAIWNDSSKQRMKKISQMAGLVRGEHNLKKSGSPHPLIIVIEPEAASVYCSRNLHKSCNVKDTESILVADLGGGTGDFLVHKIKPNRNGFTIEEVARGIGDLCGAIYVDEKFIDYMRSKIGRAFKKFESKYPRQMLKLMSNWEQIKRSFRGTNRFMLDLPRPLAKLWKKAARNHSDEYDDEYDDEYYDDIVMKPCILKMIFDPVIDKIELLIRDQLDRSQPNCGVILLVGGFSASPYLQHRVNQAFRYRVEKILNPPEPGGAICKGAVMYAFDQGVISSRIMRKTYGIKIARPYEIGDPEEKKFIHRTEFIEYTDDCFLTFVRKGQRVSNDDVIVKYTKPLYEDQTKASTKIYSSSKIDPKFVTDLGCKLESEFDIDIPIKPFGEARSIKEIMKFGTSCIEYTSVADDIDTEDPITTYVAL